MQSLNEIGALFKLEPTLHSAGHFYIILSCRPSLTGQNGTNCMYVSRSSQKLLRYTKLVIIALDFPPDVAAIVAALKGAWPTQSLNEFDNINGTSTSYQGYYGCKVSTHY